MGGGDQDEIRRDNGKNAHISERTHVPFFGRAVLVTAAFVAALVLVSTGAISDCSRLIRKEKRTSSGLCHWGEEWAEERWWWLEEKKHRFPDSIVDFSAGRKSKNKCKAVINQHSTRC